MTHSKNHGCVICGEDRSRNHPRFLLAEDAWQDKLAILQWNEDVAGRVGIQVACSIEHVEELTIHWIMTGRLDYPFARAALGAAAWRSISPPGTRIDISGTRCIGELAIHREAVERLLTENPRSLKIILDALLDALRRETSSEVPTASVQDLEREERKGACSVSPSHESRTLTSRRG